MQIRSDSVLVDGGNENGWREYDAAHIDFPTPTFPQGKGFASGNGLNFIGLVPWPAVDAVSFFGSLCVTQPQNPLGR